MTDAVSCVTKAVELALKIKDAVDTVRQNRKDCAHIKRRVERVRHTLSLCEGNAELMESPAVRDAVEALAEVLVEALELVTGCQEETNALCIYCTAGKLSKQLSKVHRGISDGNSEATFAILVYHISKQTGDGARPAMPTETGEIQQPLVVYETPERIRTPSSGSASGFSPEQTRHEFFEGGGSGCWSESSFIPKKRRRIRLVSQGRWGGGDGGGVGGFYAEETLHYFLKQISRITLAIGNAMETVRQNKYECDEIGKRASRASMILSQLEDKETTKDPAVRRALKNLLRTFRNAHELVVTCQKRSVVVLCSSGRLSSEMRGVLDEMMICLEDLIDVLPVPENSIVMENQQSIELI